MSDNIILSWFSNQQARHHYERIYSSPSVTQITLHAAEKLALIVHRLKTPASLIKMLQSNLKVFIDSSVNGVYLKMSHATLFIAGQTVGQPSRKQDNIHNMVPWPCNTNTNIQKVLKKKKGNHSAIVMVALIPYLQPNSYLIINQLLIKLLSLKKSTGDFQRYFT